MIARSAAYRWATAREEISGYFRDLQPIACVTVTSLPQLVPTRFHASSACRTFFTRLFCESFSSPPNLPVKTLTKAFLFVSSMMDDDASTYIGNWLFGHSLSCSSRREKHFTENSLFTAASLM